MKKLLLLLALTLLAAGLAGCGNSSGNVAVPEKPVLYLYPEEETEVTVTLDFDGTLTSTYPDYGDGWTVTARPGGTLTDPATGREYYCLFWEGITDAEYDFSTGFCVAGEDTAAFLEQITSGYPLDRTDFYVDMAGEAVRYSQEERTENHVIVVQLVTVLVCFPLLHALGSRSGIFPAFFPTVRREKAGRN